RAQRYRPEQHHAVARAAHRGGDDIARADARGGDDQPGPGELQKAVRRRGLRCEWFRGHRHVYEALILVLSSANSQFVRLKARSMITKLARTVGLTAVLLALAGAASAQRSSAINI